MLQLRPYQNETIQNLRQGFGNDHKRQILCLPTGAGKTVVFSEMVRLATERGTVSLILTDRIELFKQTFKALDRHGLKLQEVNAKMKSHQFDQKAKTTVGMVETIKRRDLGQYEPDLIIIDEAHKGNFTKVLDKFPNAKVIGATATPVGKHVPKYYSNIVHPIDIPQLIAEGYLSPCRAFQMVDDFSDLETSRGEYTEQSQWNHFNERKLYDGVVDKWREKANGKKTIVFNVNIEHAEKTNEAFNEAGILSEVITSKTTKEERTRILRAFSDGLFPVLNNCGILTTGYDEPSIECVIMNRKTKSLPLWLQCCGRGSRIYPGKTEFIVLDFGMNHDEHGLWEEPRKWSLEAKKKKSKQGEAAVKTCPECEAMVFASARECNFCGHEFKIKTNAPETGGKLVEVKSTAPPELVGRKISDLNLDELIEIQKAKHFKSSYVWRIVRSKGKNAVLEYAKKMNYKSGWISRQLGDLTNSRFNDYLIR